LIESETTLTPFLRGRIHVRQPKRGYRFNVDSVALAGFAWVREGERVLDLGTGSGILLLLLGHFHHPGSLTGLEVQGELAALAAGNLTDNGWGERGQVVRGDLREPSSVEPGIFDLVVCNPPYYEAGRSHTSATPERALSRQSFTAELDDVAAAAARALAPRGRFCVVVPAAREADLVAGLSSAGLSPHLARRVRDRAAAEDHLLLVQARREPAPSSLELPPLVLKEEDGSYGAEMRYWLGHDLPPGPRFFCDCMLGTLSRYLRLAGADAAYARWAEDDWLLEECRRSGRVLLTRDRPLLARCQKEGVTALDPGSDEPRRQFLAIRNAFPPPADQPLRCLGCDAPTLALERERARGRVPSYTYLTRERFTACPCCGKLTWEGTHLERFRKDVTRESGN
jgi:tRNA1Val (adenine37-N6)-methyltransferase